MTFHIIKTWGLVGEMTQGANLFAKKWAHAAYCKLTAPLALCHARCAAAVVPRGGGSTRDRSHGRLDRS
jgi:hypothetical protein